MLFDDLPDPTVFLTATRNFQNGRYFTVNGGIKRLMRHV